ncbi:hypothetical protein ACFE04_020883 [Oxalis oulophora]
MGVTYSCPLGDLDDLDNRLQAVLGRSLSLDGVFRSSAPSRSTSFNGRDSNPRKMKSYGSDKMLYKGSSLKEELETLVAIRSQRLNIENKKVVDKQSREKPKRLQISREKTLRSTILRPETPGDIAAVKLQKFYRSFRTRRQLADCAVLVEQRWWKLLDFAELKHSSISFFDIERPETAISRWSRARTRAAKVGKGLSKDEKARKLALQHWLEAIDPRHRYGHNLQFYYATWLHCQSRQPFFYWLDIGEGKEVNHERCPRQKLLQQCIKYLGPNERKALEVILENGKFVYKEDGKLLDTTQGPKDAKWIFVLSTSKTLYIGLKCKGTFQHSSFLAGGATLSAGRLVVEEGFLKAVWPHSGHYLPTEENFQEFMSFLEENNVDISNVELSPTDEEDELNKNNKKAGDGDSAQNKESEAEIGSGSVDQENAKLRKQESNAPKRRAQTRLAKEFVSKLSRFAVPPTSDNFKTDSLPLSCGSEQPEELSSDEDGYETAEESFLSEKDFMVSKVVCFDEDEQEEQEPIPKEKIMKRIDSHKVTRSYQLANHLSCKWTTGAGPRIGCMRDYPLELQAQVLEQAHLSPRARDGQYSPFSRAWTPTKMSKEKYGSRLSLMRD